MDITFLVDDKSMTDMVVDINQKKMQRLGFLLFTSDFVRLKGWLDLGVG